MAESELTISNKKLVTETQKRKKKKKDRWRASELGLESLKYRYIGNILLPTLIDVSKFLTFSSYPPTETW